MEETILNSRGRVTEHEDVKKYQAEMNKIKIQGEEGIYDTGKKIMEDPQFQKIKTRNLNRIYKSILPNKK